jgi:nicotinamidase-related amidase
VTDENPNSRTALLVMDIQQNCLDDCVKYEPQDAFVDRIVRAVDGAREAGVFVIYVRIALRPGYEEVDQRNPLTNGLMVQGRFADGHPDDALHPRLAPRPGEPIVNKRRASAFAGSDLAEILRAHDIRTLVLAGVATHGVILFTGAHACDMDYRLVILGDCCADQHLDVHEALLTKVYPRWGQVLDVDAWVERITAESGAAVTA